MLITIGGRGLVYFSEHLLSNAEYNRKVGPAMIDITDGFQVYRAANVRGHRVLLPNGHRLSSDRGDNKPIL